MNNLEFGITMMVVGMGGTVCVLSLFILLMGLLKRVFPSKEDRD
jgi:Na+-transporting methylmalonyl-CoA/oxaloacetate decarboxylase gamma subunit